MLPSSKRNLRGGSRKTDAPGDTPNVITFYHSNLGLGFFFALHGLSTRRSTIDGESLGLDFLLHAPLHIHGGYGLELFRLPSLHTRLKSQPHPPQGRRLLECRSVKMRHVSDRDPTTNTSKGVDQQGIRTGLSTKRATESGS